MSAFLILIFAIAFCVVGSSCEKKEYPIKVMSFNIRCIAFEPELNNMWVNRKDRVLQLIKDYDPDIIGFQELKEGQYVFLKENLEGYGYYGEHRGPFILTSEAAAIFWKKDRFEALEKETFWLSETPNQMSKGWDADLERICTRVTFKDKLSKQTFSHFNTHLDHKGTVARTEGLKLILNRIEESALPTILTGDFNFSEGTDRYQLILDQNLVDTKYQSPQENSDSGGTYNGFGTPNSDKPIDFIFTTKDFEAHSHKIIRDSDEEGNYPSDHFPIISEVVLKK